MTFHLDYLKRWKVWFILTAIVTVVALFGIFVRGLNYGIDFTGGTEMQLNFSRAVTTAQVNRVLDQQHLAQSTVIFVGPTHKQVQITTPTISEHERGVLLHKMNSVAPYHEISTSRVSATIGRQTERTALLAVVIATIAIILYITIRFEFRLRWPVSWHCYWTSS